MRTTEARMAVVGGGIAGLALANAFWRVGLRSDVFEQTRLFSEVGAGLQVAPNASRLLHRLGLERVLRKVAVRPTAIEMRRWDNDQLLRRTPLGDECERAFGAPYYTIHRADLHSALVNRLPTGFLHAGLRCERVEEREDRVVLHLSDGSTADADVVVGTDGIHSRTRGLMAEDQPRFSGQAIYRGLVPAERLPGLFEEPKVVLWLGPDKHVVAYPVSGGKKINVGATVPAGDAGPESWTAEGSVEDLVAAYQGWNTRVRRLVAAPESVGVWRLHDREALGHWSTARVTLAGDSAHPMLPFMAQGANQAIEDAVALATCLREAIPGTRRADPATITAALRRYERARMPRTTEVAETSRGNTRMLHLPDGVEQELRDAKLAEVPGLQSKAWLFEHDAEREVAPWVPAH